LFFEVAQGIALLSPGLYSHGLSGHCAAPRRSIIAPAQVRVKNPTKKNSKIALFCFPETKFFPLLV
jgi:hypothetical protein